MVAIKAFLLRWTARTLRSCIPQTPWGDRLYSSLHFAFKLRRLPSFKSPQHFNDHLLRFRAGPEASEKLRQRVADKVLVKEYISHAVGAEYTIPTCDVLTSEKDVVRFKPRQVPCVIKPTHASGHVIIVRNTDDEIDKNLMKSWLRLNYYKIHRERFYKDLKKRIIVEEMFSDDGINPPNDYKVFCFFGEPKFIQVITGRFHVMKKNLYTPDWQPIPIFYRYPPGPKTTEPPFLEEMLNLSRKLATPFSFIRVDFLYAKGQLKVGELTNVPDAATGKLQPPSAEKKLGRLFAEPSLTVAEAIGI